MQTMTQKILCISKANHNAVSESSCVICNEGFSLFRGGV